MSGKKALQTINLKETVIVNGMTQKELGDLIGVDRNVVNAWCNGKNISTRLQNEIKYKLAINQLKIVNFIDKKDGAVLQ